MGIMAGMKSTESSDVPQEYASAIWVVCGSPGSG